MEKQMKRTVYEAPLTDCFQIELEGAFMQSSLESGKEATIETDDVTIEVEGYEKSFNEITFD